MDTASSNSNVLEVDGSQGEGGGQILRTALSCSVLTRKPVRITKIRAGRPKPGLQKQHVACVEALATICGGASVSGAQLQSCELLFDPSACVVSGGDYSYDIGSAGSTGLVLQTVLPVLLKLAAQPSSITITGGTHNPLAPPFPFLRDVLSPLLAAAGLHVQLSLERHGFFPAGGGRLVARVQRIESSTIKPLVLKDRGKLVSRKAEALYCNLPADVARREAAEFSKVSGWPASSVVSTRVDASGPGNIVVATLVYEHVSEVVSAHGEKGKKAELVAREAADAAVADEKRPDCAPVSEHLSDQLLLPLVVAAGGTFHMASPVSSHFETNVAVLRQFFGPDVVTYRQLEGDHAGVVEVTVQSSIFESMNEHMCVGQARIFPPDRPPSRLLFASSSA